MLAPLPIDVRLPAVVEALATRRAAVLVATPGAGKTTRVPPALVGAGRVLVLQPRRVAVRAVAARIAEERGWTLGREIPLDGLEVPLSTGELALPPRR